MLQLSREPSKRRLTMLHVCPAWLMHIAAAPQGALVNKVLRAWSAVSCPGYCTKLTKCPSRWLLQYTDAPLHAEQIAQAAVGVL